jgi:hypothetical protein
MVRRAAVLVIGALWLACEPGTCFPPPPPELGKPCRDASDWGICEAGGATALVCVDHVWKRVECKARPCEQKQGQPQFAGRYWLVCDGAAAVKRPEATSTTVPSSTASP